jgi:hypothetical protein
MSDLAMRRSWAGQRSKLVFGMIQSLQILGKGVHVSAVQPWGNLKSFQNFDECAGGPITDHKL